MGIGEIGESLRRSTVHIRSTNARRPSAGSGVIWDSAGTIITNAHVIGRGEHLVELWDGRSFPVVIQAKDDQRDLARLRVGATGLHAATFRTTAMQSGEFVVAVGSPLGFIGAMTTGVVHAAGPVAGMGRRPWVQAAIRLAPGNSGGPLADAAGEVAGINTMIVASGVVTGGIALAIPSATVEEFVRDGARPRIGVTIQPVTLDRKGGVGLLILSVEPGSPAEQASLMMGDVLLGTPEVRWASAADLSDLIADADGAEGRRLKLRFLRGDRAREREVVLALAGRPAREAA
jgi:serine protease Do